MKLPKLTLKKKPTSRAETPCETPSEPAKECCGMCCRAEASRGTQARREDEAPTDPARLHEITEKI